MVKIFTSNSKQRSGDFTKAIAEMTDQLRLLDQKITMATDKEIQDEFHEQQQALNNVKYTINKRHQKQQTQRKTILHNRVAWRQSKKKLS